MLKTETNQSLDIPISGAAKTNKILKDQNEIIETRLKNVEAGIAELKKPHWSVVPSFWLLISAFILSVAAIVVSALSVPQVQKFAFPEHQSQPVISQPQNRSSGLQPANKRSEASPADITKK